MTVAAKPSKFDYLENGVTTEFSIKSRFLPGTITASRVLPDGTVVPLSAGVDFSTSGGGTDDGGTLTLTGASVAGAKLRVRRITPRTQGAVYNDNDRFPAESHEQALDRLTLISQEQDDRIADTAARALLVPDGETAPQVPPISARANRFLAFGPGGEPVMSHGTGADAGLREDLAGSTGAELVKTAVGATVQDAVDRIEPSVWHRRPIADTAVRYPDYEADRASVSAGYLYVQGFDFDDDGNIYLNIVRSSAGGTVVVAVYDSGFNYMGRFFREATELSEAIVVKGSPIAGTLKLYVKDNGNLVEYSLGTLPANGSTISAGTAKITGGCDSLFCYNDGLWLVEQNLGDLGSTSRTAWNYYDDDFSLVGRFFVPKNVVGWKTDSYANYPHVPKIQSIAMRNGKVYLGIGGNYIPETHPAPRRSADFGLVECSPDGTVLQYGVCDAVSVMARVADLGYPIARIEQEGLAIGPDGHLYSLMVTQRTVVGDADNTGYLIFREMDMLAPSWADIPSTYKPADLSRYEGKIWPRSADGKMRSPVSGEEITTMAELLTLVTELQLHHVAYYSGTYPLTAVSGFPDASENMRIDIYNLNNSTLNARVTKATSPRIQQWFRLSDGPGWTAATMQFAAQIMHIVDGITEPPTNTGYAAIFVDSADGDLKVKFSDGIVKTIVTDS